jgi:hypothetical protein
MHKRVKKTIRSMSLACAGMIMMASCSTAPPQHVSAPQTYGLVNDPILGVADAGTRCTIPAMVDLWRRRADAPLEDYPLGPGDEIRISVP